MTNRDKQKRMKQSANTKQDPDTGDPRSLAPEGDDEKETWIGQQLRTVYDKTLQEPIPQRFLELLDAIDKKDSKPK